MIYPYMVGPMSLTGFTWYQGESNAKDKAAADAYAVNFPLMIQQWRAGFQHMGAYFGFVQISTWCPPNGEGVPLLREAQMAALELGPSVSAKNQNNGPIGYATNADHGAGCNVHPPPK